MDLNRAMMSSSLEKHFMTLSPDRASSAMPLNSPIDTWVSEKALTERWTFMATIPMAISSITRLTKANSQLTMNMKASKPTIMMTEVKSSIMPVLKNWARLSTSLVNRDMMSPWAVWSK